MTKQATIRYKAVPYPCTNLHFLSGIPEKVNTKILIRTTDIDLTPETKFKETVVLSVGRLLGLRKRAASPSLACRNCYIYLYYYALRSTYALPTYPTEVGRRSDSDSDRIAALQEVS